MSLRRRALMKRAGLPSEYQAVEWVGKKNTYAEVHDCINTNLPFSDVTNIVFDGLMCPSDAYGGSNGYMLLASYVSATSKGFPAMYATDAGLTCISMTASSIPNITKSSLKNGFQSYSITISSNSSGVISFGAWTDAAFNFAWRSKEQKWYNGSTLLRRFIPCYRKSDNKPGMYDLCGSICPLTNSPFYINAGTGEFTVGPDVN